MHQTEGGFLKPLIFGGLDGILTSFAIVAGAAGGNMAVPVVLVLGFSNIFADGKLVLYYNTKRFGVTILKLISSVMLWFNISTCNGCR